MTGWYKWAKASIGYIGVLSPVPPAEDRAFCFAEGSGYQAKACLGTGSRGAWKKGGICCEVPAYMETDSTAVDQRARSGGHDTGCGRGRKVELGVMPRLLY